MDDSEEGDVLYPPIGAPAMGTTYTTINNPRPGLARRRKRFSLHRLSTDTSNSLPEYTKSPPPKSTPVVVEELPPHYSSEDDADVDDEERATASSSSHQPRKPRPQYRRQRRRHRSYSPQDPYLDALLDRSIRALELSNTLLQSSMVSQPPRTSIASADQMIDQSLDQHTQLMTARIAGSTHVQTGWMQEMDKVLKGVEELFDDGQPVPPARPRPRLQIVDDDSPHLRRETSAREQTSRPPRALTQYVSIESSWGDTLDATADESSILMPSTLGLRAAAHISNFRLPAIEPGNERSPQRSPTKPYYKHTHHAASVSDFRSVVSEPPSRNHSLPPILTHHPSAPTTPAYTLLSSIVSRETSTPPSSSRSSSRPESWRHSQGSRFSIEQVVPEEDELAPGPSAAPPRTIRSLSISSQLPPEPSSSRPIRFAAPPHRRANSLQISTSAPAQQSHFRTVASLRKILDSSPARPDGSQTTSDIKGKGKARMDETPPRILRPVPSLRLISPPSNPSTATSTATASVSHLLALSNSPADGPISLPPTPRMSSLRQSTSSLPGTPTQSGRSTPRNVSFAIEPVKYSVERGPNLNGRSVNEARKSKRKGSVSPPDSTSWWQWLAATPASGGHAPPSRTSDERSTRSYGRTMDEWMM